MVWTLHYGIAGNRARNGIVIPNKVHISLIFKKKDCFFFQRQLASNGLDRKVKIAFVYRYKLVYAKKKISNSKEAVLSK